MGKGFENVNLQALPWGLKKGMVHCCMCDKNATVEHGIDGQHNQNIDLWCIFNGKPKPKAYGNPHTMHLDDLGEDEHCNVIKIANYHPQLIVQPRELARIAKSGDIIPRDRSSDLPTQEVYEKLNRVTHKIEEFSVATNKEVDRMATVLQGKTVCLAEIEDWSQLTPPYPMTKQEASVAQDSTVVMIFSLPGMTRGTVLNATAKHLVEKSFPKVLCLAILKESI